MLMRGLRWWCLIGVLVVSGALATAACAQGAPMTAAQLVYEGADVDTQVDVNGVAAMQLVGGMLDAIVAQAKNLPPGGGPQDGPMAMLPAVMPMLDPARDAIKSLQQITVVVMKPKQAFEPKAFAKHYSDLMSGQGWSPLATVVDKDGTAVVTMIAPEAKGVFFAVNDKSEVVAGLITTSKPIGDLLGQVVQAGGGSLPMLLQHMGRPEGPPPAPQKPAKPVKPAKPAKRK